MSGLIRLFPRERRLIFFVWGLIFLMSLWARAPLNPLTYEQPRRADFLRSTSDSLETFGTLNQPGRIHAEFEADSNSHAGVAS